MDKVHLIMPMGGKGTRFFKNGYITPKPLIEINGKPFFYWATKSITKFVDIKDLTFAILQEHIDEFNIDKEILKYFPNAKIVVLKEVLNGAVLTCLEAIKNIEDDLPILFNDCDHLFISSNLNNYCNEGNFNIDGGLLTFKSNNEAYSYIKLDENNNIVGTKEKEVISNYAIGGLYYFGNKKIFEENTNKYLKKCNYSEYFLSGVYNIMAEQKCQIKNFITDEYLSFGTPEEYKIALTSDLFKELI